MKKIQSPITDLGESIDYAERSLHANGNGNQSVNAIRQNEISLLDNVREAIIILDQNDNISYWGAGAETLFGIAASDILEQPAYRLPIDTPLTAIQAQARQEGSWQGLLKGRHKNGVDLWIDATAYPDPNTQGFIILGRDVTQQRLIEQTLYFITQRNTQANPTEFFRLLVHYLAALFQLDHCLIGELDETDHTLHVLAHFILTDEVFVEPSTYVLSEADYHQLGDQPFCFCPTEPPVAIPSLLNHEATSYAHVLLKNAIGQTIGVLAFAHHAVVLQRPLLESILKIVAERAAHELERVKIEQTLSQERDFAQRLVDTPPVAILTLDLSGKIIHFNQHLAGLSGYTLEEVHGQDWFTHFLPSDDQDQTRQLFADIIEGKPQGTSLGCLVTKTGQIREIEWHNSCLHNSNKEIIGVLATGQDVTEKRHAEKAQRLIKHISNQITAVLDADLLVQTIVDLTSEAFNYYHVALFKPQGDKVVLQALAGAYTNAFPPDHTQDLDKGIIGWVGTHGEKIVCNDVTQDPRYISLIPAYSKTQAELCLPIKIAGQTLGVLDIQSQHRNTFTDHDIVALETLADQIAIALGNAQLHANLRQQLDLLQKTHTRMVKSEKLATIGELVAGVAHELNNPLASIILQAQLLQINDSDSKKNNNLDLIVQQAYRANSVVRRLLNFARQQPPKYEKIQVNDTINTTLDLLAYELRIHKVNVETQLDTSLPRIIADDHQLQQVFVNLLTNAAQAFDSNRSQDRKVTITTRLFTRPDALAGKRLQIQFIDNGPGIPTDKLTHIFESFFTTKGSQQGVGLGLSICKGIIDDHGGQIGADNMPDGGARFFIELPLITSKREPLRTTAVVPNNQKLAYSNQHILVIDDENSLVTILKRLLKKEGFSVTTVHTASAALEQLNHMPTDLILSDFLMPGLSGQEFYGHVKRMYPHLVSRLVFMTGDTINLATQAFFNENNIEHLSKPFDIDALVSTIYKALAT